MSFGNSLFNSNFKAYVNTGFKLYTNSVGY